MCIRDRDDAVKYYSNYGNAAVFKATDRTNGNIYFCSAGNTSTSGTKYRTIGYKMTIKGIACLLYTSRCV